LFLQSEMIITLYMFLYYYLIHNVYVVTIINKKDEEM